MFKMILTINKNGEGFHGYIDQPHNYCNHTIIVTKTIWKFSSCKLIFHHSKGDHSNVKNEC